jgi:nucleoside phosphorylase
MDLLIVAAFPPELAALRARLGDAMRGMLAGRDVGAEAVGIGLPGAAAGASSRIGALRPRAVVMVGTGGVYSPSATELPVPRVAVARRVRVVEPAVVEGRAAFPDPMSLACEASAPIADALIAEGGVAVDVATTLAVTTDDALASRVAHASGCAVEHLEAYAVAVACATFGVPFACALGVANVVGSTARAEWRAHHRVAGDAAVALVLAWLDAGGVGLVAS